MTYSIVARHPTTGELGVASQSHYFALGVVVPWARAGVGAVATQASALASYGPLGLEGLQAGEAPDALLGRLVEDDDQGADRQVALVDATGRVAAHTGSRCIDHAGHVTGPGYSVQGNMLRSAGQPEAMAEAWERASGAGGTMADGLLAALDAAEAAGGDVRGRQSAALVVVGADRGEPWAPPAVSLRVDDHRAPLVELRRLVGVQAAYAGADAAFDLVDQARPDEAVAIAAGWADATGGNPELGFWLGRRLVAAGRADLGDPLIAAAVGADEGWAALRAWMDGNGR